MMDTTPIRFENATFTLPILFGSYVNNQGVSNIQKHAQTKFNFKLPIDSFYGAPWGMIWNGGRPLHYQDSGINNHTIPYYKSIDAHRYITCTNYLAGDYLDDPTSNQALEMLLEGDGVIITDERLHKYIRKTYPKLKTKSSIVKVTKDQPNKRTVDYYNQLLDAYDYVVLHPDDNSKTDFISQIKDLSRIEVLIDERCTANCPVRDLHYDLNAHHNLPIEDRDSDILDQEEELFSKLCPREKSIMGKNGKWKLDILVNTKDEISVLYDLGIRKFKTSGRGAPMLELYAIKRFLDVAIKDEQTRNTLEYFL